MASQKVSEHGTTIEQLGAENGSTHLAVKPAGQNGTPKAAENNGSLTKQNHKHEHKHDHKQEHKQEHKKEHKQEHKQDHKHDNENKQLTHKGETKKTDIVTSIPEAPVTEERELCTIGDSLPQAGLARANLAATVDKPEGTTENDWAKQHRHQTVLQQHCDFFDRDHDGIIWPQDTYIGFRRIGFGVILSFISLLIIHLNFSYPTGKSWIPDPRLLVHLDAIDKDKHGGDSGSYDNEGRFIPQHFENIFTKYAEGRDYLTAKDLTKMWDGQRVLNDMPGMIAMIFEWGATYLMLWPEDGKLKKEDIRGIYDGSIFYTIAERREGGGKKKLQ